MTRRLVSTALALVVAGAVVGCTGSSSEPPSRRTPSATPTSSAPTPTATAAACQVTVPTRAHIPGVRADALFGSDQSYGNGKLWVGGLGEGGVIRATPVFVNADGSIGWKLGWWRAVPGKLVISGRRLDAPAPALVADVPDGYGPTGFQASGVTFPTKGCWEITGSVGTTDLTFVVSVVEVPRR